MIQEEKQLLLKDLCARLPYGVMVQIEEGLTVELWGIDLYEINRCFSRKVYQDIKPYLRPMSSMTDKELNEFISVTETILGVGKNKYTIILNLDATDWLNEHHFDYRGLIEKGLAIEVTKENNPYENGL